MESMLSGNLNRSIFLEQSHSLQRRNYKSGMTDGKNAVHHLDSNMMDNAARFRYMELMLKNNEESITLLQELNANVRKLAAANNNNNHKSSEPKQILEKPNETLKNMEDPSSQDQTNDTGERMSRATVRLDGLEVYAVVSALTCATLYQCFDSFDGDDWGRLYEQGHFLDLLADIVFLFSSATGILAGLHATLVFSLMTMYGRTAIGMAHDDIFNVFLQSTSEVRFRGFKTFLWSMYAFLIQVGIVITSKVPVFLRILFLIALSCSMFEVYKDTKGIVDHAGIMFSCPMNAPVPENNKNINNQGSNMVNNHNSKPTGTSGCKEISIYLDNIMKSLKQKKNIFAKTHFISGDKRTEKSLKRKKNIFAKTHFISGDKRTENSSSR